MLFIIVEVRKFVALPVLLTLYQHLRHRPTLKGLAQDDRSTVENLG